MAILKFMPVLFILFGIMYLINFASDRDLSSALSGVGAVVLGLGWYRNGGLTLGKGNPVGAGLILLGLALCAAGAIALFVR